jgi:hypothetical protein
MIRKHFRFKRLALGLAFAAVAAAVLVPTAGAVSSEISVQAGVTPLQAEGQRWQAMADFYRQKDGGRPATPSEMSVQSTITPIQADAMRYQAMAKFYADNKPGKTAAGTAIANQQHKAYSVPVTTSAAGSTGFSWSDAGIGASAVFAGLLVMLTVVGLGRRHRSRGLASA